jgi:hypothetical protein
MAQKVTEVVGSSKESFAKAAENAKDNYSIRRFLREDDPCAAGLHRAGWWARPIGI